MEVDCEGCAGCCIDWREVAPGSVDLDHERRGRFVPLDDSYNLVPLSSDEVRTFLREGFGDAMTPRLFIAAAPETDRTTVDDYDLVSVGERPVFLVGLRKTPKPVGPFGVDPTWLPACVFLDPETLQCRIHGDDRYPDACAGYPGDNLALDVETECERVEDTFGDDRLVDDNPGAFGPLFGPGSLGSIVFAHPAPDRLIGRVERIAGDEPTLGDRAEFIAAAAASSPGSLAIDDGRYEAARRRIFEADSWVGRAIEEWRRFHDADSDPDPALGDAVERRRGAPETSGWQ